MRKKRGITNLTPGGKLVLGGAGVLVVLFLAWQFIISPIFVTRSSTSDTSQAQNSTDSNQNSTATAKAELTGQILDANYGIPLSGAVIKRGDGSELAKTDSEGKFAIGKLPADKTKLMIVAPGYAPLGLPLAGDAAKNIKLQPTILNGQLLDADTQKPIANRMVNSSVGAAVTDENGKFTLNKVTADTKVSVQLVGYEKVEQAVDLNNLGNFSLSIRSTVFEGSLTDSSTGKPIANALIKNGDLTTNTNAEGKFRFSDAPRGPQTEYTVRASGYKIQTFKAKELSDGVKIAPFKFRGVYVPGVFAIAPNYDDLYAPYFKMADQGLINAVVLGVKDDDTGLLWYDSKVPLATQLGLIYDKNNVTRNQLMNVKKILDESHKHGLYVVARYVVYRDPGLASKKPEWTLKSKKTGKSWIDASGLSWPNQFIPEVGDYNAALAKELAELGFDEVQYDYIRFPSDGDLSDIQYNPSLDWTELRKNEKLRTDTIEGTVLKAWNNLRTTNTFLSLDVFGYSLWREDDADGIGQQYNNLAMISDYICPMVYPTHFSAGEMGFPDPGAKPKEIIEQSGKIANKLEQKLNLVAKYRPWLEDFDKTWGPKANQVKTSPERVKVQIVAADSLGASGWTLWNPNGKYLQQPLAQTVAQKP